MIALNQRLLSIQHQAVRDLAWCCFSAPLIQQLADTQVRIFPQCEPQDWQWLTALDQAPGALLQHIAQLKSTRLGIYYEALWQFYFMQHPNWELLAYNQQIYNEGITTGAFDFLCRRGHEYIHIETAVKFYLRHPAIAANINSWDTWIGPNTRDRLDLKLHHLQQHQLPLSGSAAGQAYLKDHYPQADHWHQALCLQGYLFAAHATDSGPQHSIAPLYSNPHHQFSSWCFVDNFLQQLAQSELQFWQILERHQWLSPAQTQVCEQLTNPHNLSAQIRAHYAATKKPLLVAALTAFDGTWQETQRIFIVPSTWPN